VCVIVHTPIKDNINLIRDETSQAVLNIDETARDKYLKQRAAMMKKQNEIEHLKNEVSELKSGMNEILRILNEQRVNSKY
jgi:hypothetical protein